MADHPLRIPPEALRRFCNPDDLGFETTEDIAPVIGTVGQDRAVAALDFGLEINTPGYNLFVTGVPGSGRSTTVLSLVNRLAKDQPTPQDWCYIYNFEDPFRPKHLNLPAGAGPAFAKDMDELVAQAKLEIPKAFESDVYQQRRQQLVSRLDSIREDLHRELESEAQAQGFTVQFSPAGIITVPLVDGKAMSGEEYQALSEERRQELREHGQAFQEQLVTFTKGMREAEQAASQDVRRLDQETVLFAVGHLVQNVADKYAAFSDIVAFLEEVQNDIVENLENFRPQQEDGPPAVSPMGPQRVEDPFVRYRVNVLVTNQRREGGPVVVENNPTYYNLMGRIDYQPAFGTMHTNFRMIKPGALHRANGGYLVLQARDVLMSPLTWEALKRALDTREIAIENIGDMMTAVPTQTLRPAPIPLDLKVIIIGTPMIYNLLYQGDEEFRKLFKAKADFDIEMERTPENVAIYAGFIRARVEQDGLLPFHKTGVAKVVEHGSRLLEHQERLSTRFIDVQDLVSEASFWAQKSGSSHVTAEHVQRAIQEKEFRSSLTRDKVQEVITEGVISIATEGSVVGQINGLSVLDSGDYVFGIPSRITVRTAPGSAGVVNVEREIEMSGKIHSKGVLILSGYLSGRYAQEMPLGLSASLTFEQLYNEVDGDSASSAELYCILSALAGLPLRQDLAVTGSINQKGEVQAVGGVQYKIEGFYDICKVKGLTGDQGVIIPATNLRHLMLREDVVEAVRAGQFHVYVVHTVDEGVELLTGVPAGQAKDDGEYPAGTVNWLVSQQLQAYAELLRDFGQGPEAKEKNVP